jgi:serine/threonine protein kinase
VQQLQTEIKTAQDNLNQAIVKQSNNIVELAQQLQNWQQVQLRHDQLIHFSSRFENQLTQMLEFAQSVYASLDEIHEDVIDTQKDVKKILALVAEISQKLTSIEERQGISAQIKARDEFTVHNSTSLKLIEEAVALLKQLPTQNPEYSLISIRVGSALSSTGAFSKAEHLFQQAIENAHNEDDKALAYFDLFQVQLRRKAYPEALEHLQAAIKINRERFALHNVKKYPIRQLLGAGGMGCVLLCENQDLLRNPEHKQVAVKCFWESHKGEPDEVFGEALKMHKIAGDSVPKPLDYGYADESNEERAFFVSEYLSGAIDGEVWLEKYGPLDLETGSTVALQIAKGLQLAHEAGIYHLDLKPANILLKKTETVSVKIIDFGLSQVAPSLREEAVVQQSRSSGLSTFGQAIFGTLDYAPPEQRGYIQYGKPSAQSDMFAFGKTMYRLLTGEIPIEVEKEELEHAPDWFELLSNCVRANPKKRPSSALELVKRLKVIEEAQKIRQDEKAWQAACEQNTKSAYQAYLDGETLKKSADEAKQRLQAIEQEELAKRRKAEEERKKREDENAWLKACQQNTKSAYQAYLDGETLKNSADEAKQRLQAIEQEELAKRHQAEQEQKEREDENAWLKAYQQNTKSAYQAYLDGNTVKKYAENAKAWLQAIVEKEEMAKVLRRMEQKLKEIEDETAWLKAHKQDKYAENAKAWLQAIIKEELAKALSQLEQKLKKIEDETAWLKARILYRYTDNGNGTVTDNRTGLIWLKKADCFGTQDWETAKQSVAKLADGQCGLNDGSKAGDWRLPTEEELKVMVDDKYTNPALSNAAGTGQWKEGDPFQGVMSSYYWSSTSKDTFSAWGVYISGVGFAHGGIKAHTSYVWAVRGGH